jgi:hypothetical protein
MRSVQEALAAMRSCIKSGEPWTETMQRAYDAAMSEAALPARSGYVEPLVPSVHAEAGWEAKVRRENGGRIPPSREVNAASADMDSGPHGGALHSAELDAAIGSLASFQARVSQGLPQQSAVMQNMAAHSTDEDSARPWRESVDRVLPPNHGQVIVGGISQPSAPGKMFSREAICAIVRAERARASRITDLEQQMVMQHTCDNLLAVFENLE